MTNKTYKSALVGLGNVAWQYDGGQGTRGIVSHASAYKRHKKISLVAGYSPIKKSRDSFNEMMDLATYDDLEKMLHDINPDIVSICSPNSFHFDQLKICIDKNIPMVWLEKPATTKVSQLIELINHNNVKGNTKVLVGYQRRYSKIYKKIKDIFISKQYGEAKLIEIQYSKGLENNGIHMLDLLFFINEGSEYKIISADFLDTENPTVILEAENNIRVVIIGNNLSYHNVDISITFDRGRVSVLHGGMHYKVEKCVKSELFSGSYQLKEIISEYTSSNEVNYMYVSVLDDLVTSYEKKREPLSNLETSKFSQELLELINNYRYQ